MLAGQLQQPQVTPLWHLAVAVILIQSDGAKVETQAMVDSGPL